MAYRQTEDWRLETGEGSIRSRRLETGFLVQKSIDVSLKQKQ